MGKRKKEVFVIKIGGCERNGDEKFGLIDKDRSKPYRLSISGAEKREVSESELKQFLGLQMRVGGPRISEEIDRARRRYDEEVGEGKTLDSAIGLGEEPPDPEATR